MLIGMSSIEKNTNQLLRKKYFVDPTSVLTRRDKPKEWGRNGFSRIIPSSAAVLSATPVSPSPLGSTVDSRIKVHVTKEDGKVQSLRITCPCGRHAEINCEHSPADALDQEATS